MAYLSKDALLEKTAQGAKVFDIELPDNRGTLRARELSAKEHAEWWKADDQHKNPIIRMMLLALLCLCDPEDSNKRLFDPEKDLEIVGKMPLDDLIAIRDQYQKHIDPPKDPDAVKELAKNSEATTEDASSSDSVAS